MRPLCYTFDYICRSGLLFLGLMSTTVVLGLALVLVMAEEFRQLPLSLQKMSSALMLYRNRRTVFICFVVTLMCLASTLGLVSSLYSLEKTLFCPYFQIEFI